MAKVDADHTIPFYLAGIPCQIAIGYYFKQEPWKGSALSCPSRDDYYGYTESEWMILDRKGYRAAWLERKITASIEAEIDEAIEEYMEECRKDAEEDAAADAYDSYMSSQYDYY